MLVATRGVAHPGRDAQGVDRASGQGLAEGPGPLEAQAALGVPARAPARPRARRRTPSAHRSDSATSRATMFHPNRPSGSRHHDPPIVRHRLAGQHAALDPRDPTRWPPSSGASSPAAGSSASASGRFAHQASLSTSSMNRCRSTRRWHHANSSIAVRSADATSARDGRDRPPHGRLAATVVELGWSWPRAGAGRRGAGRRGASGRGRRRARRTSSYQRAARTCRSASRSGDCASRLGDQGGAHQRVDLVPPGRRQAGHEQPALLGVAEHLAGVGPARQRPGEARVHPVDDREVGQRVDQPRDPRRRTPRARRSAARA